jgi:hypothetical protein
VENEHIASRINDLTGRRFGRWSVLRFSGTVRRRARWLCQCDCGTQRLVTGNNLTRTIRPSLSCGCIKRLIDHGHCRRGLRTRTYRAWCQMRDRCGNENSPRYKYYGGRGISVCPQWQSFANFCQDMGDPPTNRHSLDRIDNDKGYCKDNCRWATQLQQTRNSRHNRLLTFNSHTLCVTEWAEEVGLPARSIHNRLRLGWSIEKTLTTPPLRRRKHQPAA